MGTALWLVFLWSAVWLLRCYWMVARWMFTGPSQKSPPRHKTTIKNECSTINKCSWSPSSLNDGQVSIMWLIYNKTKENLMPSLPKTFFVLHLIMKLDELSADFLPNLFCVWFLYAKEQWLEDIKDTLDASFKINAEYKTDLFTESFSCFLIWLFY